MYCQVAPGPGVETIEEVDLVVDAIRSVLEIEEAAHRAAVEVDLEEGVAVVTVVVVVVLEVVLVASTATGVGAVLWGVEAVLWGVEAVGSILARGRDLGGAVGPATPFLGEPANRTDKTVTEEASTTP